MRNDPVKRPLPGRLPAARLREVLEDFYCTYNFGERIEYDPVIFPRSYGKPADIEVAGFIASCFAYGRVEVFTPVIRDILASCGQRPARFVLDFSVAKHAHRFRSCYYRFSTAEDITCLLYLVGRALRQWGSLRELFTSFYGPGQRDTGSALAGFADYFMSADTTPVYGRNIRPHGLRHFFSSPLNGSTCKRMNLFLRWMVRTEDTDFGLWKTIPASKLIIPLDVHMARISRCLNLTKRANPDWKTAQEITESLKAFDPRDPLKYDFALCHMGISGACRGRSAVQTCATCIFFPFTS